jgi:ubiquinone/menaquinone biosynthesis C-methylase UbiE
MSDINLYNSYPDKYNELQNLRPDYPKAIKLSLELANKYTVGQEINLFDICCGTGSNSLAFSKMHPLNKVLLVDINQEFLNIAKDSEIDAKEKQIICSDIRFVSDVGKNYNLVFSIFAYHHVPDADKASYVQVIKDSMVEGGILVLTEIFFDSLDLQNKYYKDLFNSIDNKYKTKELQEFLEQTSNSSDSEFKVSKNFTDKQFADFELLEETKIWPNSADQNGTFIQIYKKV